MPKARFPRTLIVVIKENELPDEYLQPSEAIADFARRIVARKSGQADDEQPMTLDAITRVMYAYWIPTLELWRPCTLGVFIEIVEAEEKRIRAYGRESFLRAHAAMFRS